MKKFSITESRSDTEIIKQFTEYHEGLFSSFDFAKNVTADLISPLLLISDSLVRNLEQLGIEKNLSSELCDLVELTASEVTLRAADFKPKLEILNYTRPAEIGSIADFEKTFEYCISEFSKNTIRATLSSNIRDLANLYRAANECVDITESLLKLRDQIEAHNARVSTVKEKNASESETEADSDEEDIKEITNIEIKIAEKRKSIAKKVETLRGKLAIDRSIKEDDSELLQKFEEIISRTEVSKIVYFDDEFKKKRESSNARNRLVKKGGYLVIFLTLITLVLGYSEIKLTLDKKKVLNNRYAKHFLTKYHIERIKSATNQDDLYTATFESLKKGKETRLADLIKSILNKGYPLNFSSNEKGLIVVSVSKKTLAEYAEIFGDTSSLKLVFMSDIREPQDFFKEELKFSKKIFKLKELCNSDKKISLIAKIDSPYKLVTPYSFPAEGINISKVMRTNRYCEKAN